MKATKIPLHRLVDADHPWLGLESFTEATQKYFFGRDTEIAEIFVRTRENGLTVLYGRSGLGKTSLLGAGLIPKLKIEGYRPALVRLRYEKSDPPLIDQVKAALASVTSPSGASETLWELLHHNATRDTTLDTAPPVLIFDQLEEVFTLGQRAERAHEVRALFTELGDVIENRPPADLKQRFQEERKLAREYDLGSADLRVVITLREDYLSHLEQWKRVLPSLMRNRMALHLLSGMQALEAVMKPGQMEGRCLVDEETAARIVRFVANRGPDADLKDICAVPPLLSLVCDQLNSQRLEQGRDRISAERVSTSIEDADETEDELEVRSRLILERFYLHSFAGFPSGLQSFVEDRMVTVGGHRSPVSGDDSLAALSRFHLKAPAEALQTLVTRRLISTEERDGVQWFEITHDVLLPIVCESRDKRLARQRLRRMVSASAGLLTLVAVLGGMTVWARAKQREADSERNRANETVERLEAAGKEKEELLWKASRGDFEAAVRAFDQKDRAEGLAYLDRALGYRPINSAALAASAMGAVGPSAPLFACRAVGTFEDRLYVIAFSPDGRWVATGSGDKTLRVLESANGQEVSRMMFDGPVNAVSFSADGRWVAAGSGDKTLRVMEVASGREVSRMEFRDTVHSVCFSPDGQLVAGGSADQTLRVLEVATGKQISRTEFGATIYSVSFSPDGERIAAASFDKTLRVMEAESGKQVSKVAFGGPVFSVCFSPDGRWVAAGSDDRTARVLDAESSKQITRVEFGDSVTSVSFSPDGRWVAAGSGDNTVRVFDAATGMEISKMAFEGTVCSVSFSPDGRWLAAGSHDHTLRVLEIASGQEVSKTEFGDIVYSVSFSPDGRWLAAGAGDETLRVFETASGKEDSMVVDWKVSSLSFSMDGRWLAAGSGDRTLRVLEAATCREVSKVEFGDAVTAVGFSRDGHQVVAGSADQTLRVFESASGNEVSKVPFGGVVNSVSFSPNGRWVAAGSQDNTMRVLDAASGKEISKAQFDDSVTAVSFSPDGRWVVAGSADETLRVLEAASGQPVSMFRFKDIVCSVGFSPDGRWVVGGSYDNTLQVVGAANGKEAFGLVFDGPVYSVGFSPDGRWLGAGSGDKTLRVIEVSSGREVSKMEFGDSVTSVSFGSDGRWIAGGSEDNTLRVLETAIGKQVFKAEFADSVTSVISSQDGRWLAAGSADKTLRMMEAAWLMPLETERTALWGDLLRFQAGQVFEASGRLQPLPPEEWARLNTQVHLAPLPTAKRGAEAQGAILRWFRALPERRAVSPWIATPLWRAVGEVLMRTAKGQTIAISRVANRAPWHPLGPVSLARSVEELINRTDASTVSNPVRAAFLARLTLKRLGEADDKLYGRETLAEYSVWAANVMHDELNLNVEAGEAIAFALERTPKGKHGPLLELQRRWVTTE